MKHALNRLIYAAQGGNATNDNPYMLRWLAARLVEKHGEDPKVDFIQAARQRADMLEVGLVEARNARFRGERNLWTAFKAAVTRVCDGVGRSLQDRTADWIYEVCKDDPTDLPERRARFIEEALELVQSLGMSQHDVEQVVAYVFSRPVGMTAQEFGGAHLTMLALANHTGFDVEECSEEELDRCWQQAVIDKIRRKRSTRHERGPLPGVGSVTELDTLHTKPVDASTITVITGDMILSTDKLKSERQELEFENARAPGWGAAVGARHERIQEIDRELARRG